MLDPVAAKSELGKDLKYYFGKAKEYAPYVVEAAKTVGTIAKEVAPYAVALAKGVTGTYF